MQRELVEVCPDIEGWRVLGREVDFRHPYDTKFQAIQHASSIAAARHKKTRRATGVSVETPSGTAMLVACCG